LIGELGLDMMAILEDSDDEGIQKSSLLKLLDIVSCSSGDDVSSRI
jgi:hypothetical protein